MSCQVRPCPVACAPPDRQRDRAPGLPLTKRAARGKQQRVCTAILDRHRDIDNAGPPGEAELAGWSGRREAPRSARAGADWCRFPSAPIDPCVRFSRTRLTDVSSRARVRAPGRRGGERRGSRFAAPSGPFDLGPDQCRSDRSCSTSAHTSASSSSARIGRFEHTRRGGSCPSRCSGRSRAGACWCAPMCASTRSRSRRQTRMPLAARALCCCAWRKCCSPGGAPGRARRSPR